MRLLAIVRTMESEPEVPVFDDAWDAAVAEANPLGIRQSLADALMESTTRWATIVEIDVSDAALLERLQRPRPRLAGVVEPDHGLGASAGGACVFCAIAAGEAPATVVRSWPDAIAIRPLGPVVDGHVLIVPRVHVEDAGSDPTVTAAVMSRASELLADVPSGNLIMSRGAAATQTVPHLHVHLVPREQGDGLPLPWTTQQAAGGQ